MTKSLTEFKYLTFDVVGTLIDFEGGLTTCLKEIGAENGVEVDAEEALALYRVARYSDATDGGVHRAAFYVLVGARMPAVLFETSYISHLGDEQRLGSADYQQRLADAIVNAVKAYREGR